MWWRNLRLLFGFSLFALSGGLIPVLAQPLSLEQNLYRSALEALRQQRTGEAYALQARLGDYPLAPYVTYYDLYWQPQVARLAEVKQFMRRYPGSYLASRLERRYLHLLAQEQNWHDFLGLRPAKPNSVDLQCYYYRAQLAKGQRDLAFDGAAALWLHGDSRPGECDRLFAAWRDAGRLSDSQIWARQQLAFAQGNAALVKYLSGLYQSTGWQRLGKRITTLQANPDRLFTLLPAGREIRDRRLAELTLQRWANQDAPAVLRTLPQAKQRYGLRPPAVASVEQAIARRLLLDRSRQQRHWLDSRMDKSWPAELLELRARVAIYESDWPAVNRTIALMAPAQQGQSRWRYWRGRAEQQAGQTGAARHQFELGRQERSYYGFLSAQQLGKPFFLQQTPLKRGLDWKSASRRWDALLRIEALLQLDETDLAHAEWYYLVDQVSYDEKLQLGGLALAKGWHHLAVQASIRAEAWDVLELRFPTPLSQTFSQFAQARALEPSLLYALARQESALYPKAKSPVGATGLMQLMPATAKHTAKKWGYPQPRPQQLVEPTLNIRLGSAYLRELLDQYQGNRVLATAAYNAGPGRVRQWRSSAGMPMDAWVESIPFRETRNYVQNVLVYNVIYQQQLKRPLRFLSEGELTLRY
ncbi:MAG: transglycosylase SLT domain-containing protein [Aeromonadaceae bacterium]|nr:transglycosylase SLT domain-containing protein [Aeromonadaceae bacterium]